jgi:hypothetical protein
MNAYYVNKGFVKRAVNELINAMISFQTVEQEHFVRKRAYWLGVQFYVGDNIYVAYPKSEEDLEELRKVIATA